MADGNKAFVLGALDLLFNARDYVGAAPFFSPNYIQHSRLVPPGRDGLFEFTRGLPQAFRYESGVAIAEGDTVMVHGRYSGMDIPDTIAVDIFRMQDGVMVEHWDVLQEEATEAESAGGHPMFGDRFA